MNGMMRSRRAIRAMVWTIVVMIAAPPPLMAQTLGGSGGSPFALPGLPGTGSPQILPGAPIVTNPTALQPLAPPQTPCPAPSGPTYAASGVMPSLNEFWPTETGTLLPSSVEQRMRQERAERIQHEREEKAEQSRAGGGGPLAAKPLSPPSPLQATAGAAAGIVPGPMLSQTTTSVPKEPALTKDFSIEEAFAQFSVLEGVKAKLRQFGYEFFDTQASSFAPVLDVPVGPDYVIGPQDSLAIHIWNVPDQNFNRSYIVPVERDGMIVIPQVGAVAVGGLTFSQAERAIASRLGSLLKRFDVHVAMARLRTMKVYVVGEVVRPGAYEVSALATVSNAVYAACGPSRSGSLRQVRLVRGGQVRAELDFYQFLMWGDRSQDHRLQAGDVIVVPPLGPVAAISGAVKRPAIYELKPGVRLSDLLQLAGGLTPVADRQRCHLFRVEPGKGRVIIDVGLSSVLSNDANGRSHPATGEMDPLIQDGDYIRIGSVATQVANVVSLAGAVKSPGPYEFKPGMSVRDLVTPDQLTVDAYQDRAEIVRTDPVTYQTTIIPFNPKALFAGDKSADLPLQRLDQIVIGSQVRPPRVVSVDGEVKRPGYYTLESGERLSSVLKRAGGFTANAFPAGIVLIRESVRRNQQAELSRFLAAERQRLTAQSAAIAAGTAGIGGAATSGTMAEQGVLSLRLEQLEAAVSRVELGRVVVHLESLERLEGTDDDIVLEGGDKIHIPQPPKTVSLIGAVKHPTTIVYRPGMDLDEYLAQAGGFTEDANKKEIYVTRANGTTESAYVRAKGVQPGDTIVVPQKIEAKTPQLALWQSVASIIGSVALAAAGIAVVGR